MSFYTSLNGMKNAQTDLGVIAHNIANAETNGFKRSDTEFADLVVGSAITNPRLVQGIGARVTSITQDFELGPIEQTGTALDLAITGDGFFPVENPESGNTYYTRNGSFQMDETGFITDTSGNRLQIYDVDAAGNPLTPGTTIDAQVPLTNLGGAELAGVTVERDGMLSAAYADGSIETVGRVSLAGFVAPTGLRQVGDSNWEATGISGTASLGLPGVGRYGSLLSGALERSNVDLAEEMVSLITAQRNFQANAKAIDTASQISQTVINLRT